MICVYSNAADYSGYRAKSADPISRPGHRNSSKAINRWITTAAPAEGAQIIEFSFCRDRSNIRRTLGQC